MIQEQAAAAVIVVLISEKNKPRKNRKKRRVCEKPWLKRRKNLEFYETRLAKLRLEYEYNNNILLQMASENFEQLFQMIKDDITKENTKTIIRTCSHNLLFINMEVIQELCLRVLVFVLNY